MLSEAKAIQLIGMYDYICEQLQNKDFQGILQRTSPNRHPLFTDAELVTLYLFGMQTEQRFQLKQIHRFADQYLRSWFPRLPSYQACNYRVNQLSEVFKLLSARCLQHFRPPDCSTQISILDSVPIQTCSAKRKAKVAQEITDKGYCATKSKYYYGLKLHLLGWQYPGRMPHPERITLSTASEHDLNVFRQDWSHLEQRVFVGDKIYCDKTVQAHLKQHSSYFYTPVKAVKDKPAVLVQWDRAAEDLFSRAVSSIRQPIESLFNWLIEKTDLQNAAKVRSTKGLLCHVFARIAAAFIYLIFNS